jgi:hypothetical protein
MKKISAILSALLLVLCMTISAFASNASTFKATPEGYALDQVSTISHDDPECPWNKSTEITQTTTLYGLDERPNGYIYELATDGIDTGFIQIIKLNFAEYSLYCYAFEGESEVQSMADYWNRNIDREKIYFLGSFQYMIQSDDGYLNLADNQIVNVEASTLAAFESAYFEQVHSSVSNLQEQDYLNASQQAIPDSFSATPLRGSEDDYTWPTVNDSSNVSVTYNNKTHYAPLKDHCSPTAATGIIRYFNHIGKTHCTSGETSAATFCKLYIALNTNDIRYHTIGGNDGGTVRDQIAIGIRWYASNNGSSITAERMSFVSMNNIKRYLNSGWLLLGSVNNWNGGTGGHSIVITGYSGNNLYVQNGMTSNRIAYSYSSINLAQVVYVG